MLDRKKTYRERKSDRFLLSCKKLLAEHAREILLTVGVCLGTVLVLGLWSGYLGAGPGNANAMSYAYVAGWVCAFIASISFSFLRHKEEKISCLMLPASAADKFWPRVLAVIPGMMLLAIVGYYVLSGSMILGHGLSYGYWPGFYNPFKSVECPYLIAFLSTFLLQQSVFLFGAIAWPRMSMLKTMAVIFGVILLITTIGIVWAHYILDHNLIVMVDDYNATLWIIAGVALGLTAVIVWSAFERFKRVRVIS